MVSKRALLAGDERWVHIPDAHHRHPHPARVVMYGGYFYTNNRPGGRLPGHQMKPNYLAQ